MTRSFLIFFAFGIATLGHAMDSYRSYDSDSEAEWNSDYHLSIESDDESLDESNRNSNIGYNGDSDSNLSTSLSSRIERARRRFHDQDPFREAIRLESFTYKEAEACFRPNTGIFRNIESVIIGHHQYNPTFLEILPPSIRNIKVVGPRFDLTLLKRFVNFQTLEIDPDTEDYSYESFSSKSEPDEESSPQGKKRDRGEDGQQDEPDPRTKRRKSISAQLEKCSIEDTELAVSSK